MATNFCTLAGQGFHTQATVELLVNGEPVAGRTFVRKHRIDSAESFTVTGQAKLVLNQNDVVSVRVTPLRKYMVKGNGCSLTVERMRIFQ